MFLSNKERSIWPCTVTTLGIVLAVVLGLVGVFPALCQAEWPAVEGGAPVLNHTERLRQLGSPPKTVLDYSRASIPLAITLPPVTNSAQAQLHTQAANQPLQIGFGRELPEAYRGDISSELHWRPLADGRHVGSLSLTSPQAQAVRVAVLVPALATGVQLRFFNVHNSGRHSSQDSSQDSSQVFGPLHPTAEQLLWSPVIDGDTIGIEISLSASTPLADFSLHVVQVSHLVASVHSSDERRLTDIGRSGLCNIDVACQETTPPQLAAATAKMVFTRSGATFLCTGILLQDTDADTAIPYFVTAHHCLHDQAAANTVNTFWSFERETCDGPLPTSVIQFIGGADLLATGQDADFSFLQLNDTAVSTLPGIWFAGWDSTPLELFTPVIGLHHPRGDLKKWSAGGITDFTANPLLVVPSDNTSHARLVWSQGTTEPGSSGSGIFDITGKLRGTLSGGLASCGSPGAPDFYGRFDKTFPAVERWLSTVPRQLDSAMSDPITGSVQQGEWVEYKILTTAAASRLHATLYDLSQDADVSVRIGSRPSEREFDCRPALADTSPETCQLSASGDRVYYIGVNGIAPGETHFRLDVNVQESGEFDFCSVDEQCGQGLGDCDSNSECTDDLRCVHNIGPAYGFPSWVDVCENDAPLLGEFDFCSERAPCGQGQGDCDDTDECLDGLVCLNNVGTLYGFEPQTDVCEVAGTRRGAFNFCAVTGPCGVGVGDCDNDSECQTGLVCRHNVGDLYGFQLRVDVCEMP